jgi:hypothetical protein
MPTVRNLKSILSVLDRIYSPMSSNSVILLSIRVYYISYYIRLNIFSGNSLHFSCYFHDGSIELQVSKFAAA